MFPERSRNSIGARTHAHLNLPRFGGEPDSHSAAFGCACFKRNLSSLAARRNSGFAIICSGQLFNDARRGCFMRLWCRYRLLVATGKHAKNRCRVMRFSAGDVRPLRFLRRSHTHRSRYCPVFIRLRLRHGRSFYPNAQVERARRERF
jgi:hypothetical protein